MLNQPPALEDYDPLGQDRTLGAALAREGAGWARERVAALARRVGGAEVLRWGFEANEHPPALRTHDRFGNRIDEVDFHPSWHRLMELAVSAGVCSLAWRDPRPGAHAARAALMMLMAQAEAGHSCPTTMTFAAVPALRATPELAAEWEPLLTAGRYQPGSIPAARKAGAVAGMAMTERQGGSDVRANTTRALPVEGGGPGGEYELTGHKWFCSAPMSDVFLMLAQAPEGLSCFVVPRVLADGTRNAIHLQRLKPKLGNRSNASAEIELHGARGRLLGEPGRGVPTIIEMVNHTRLDCALGSAAGMRLAVAQAVHHARHRRAFGAPLAGQPAMTAVLADLCIESEAATLATMRLAGAYDAAGRGDERSAALRRLATAVLKYWVCKRGPAHAAEALECLGGNGYVEESVMPRLYREQPLASIWEGSGNVQCLDVLRAVARHPASLEAFLDEVRLAAGADRRLDAHVARLRDDLAVRRVPEAQARGLVERMALALQASLLVRHGLPASADAFCAARLGGEGGLAFGTLPAGADCPAIVEHHWPQWG